MEASAQQPGINTPNIEWTCNYSLFKSIDSNREIKEAHVKKLVQSIMKDNLLEINPIVVNAEMEVIDGQHRLEAAQRLNVPVYYIKSAKATKNNIATLNSNSKKWTPVDYLNYWKLEGVPEYTVISNFVNLYPELNISTVLNLLSANGSRNTESFRAGVVNVSNYDNAVAIAEIINSFADYCDFAYQNNFILAVRQVYMTGHYDHKVMEQKLEYQSRNLVKCVSCKQYVELIEEIYNYRAREENRVRFS